MSKDTEAAAKECRLITVAVNEVQALRSGPSAICVPNIHSGATPVLKIENRRSVIEYIPRKYKPLLDWLINESKFQNGC